MISYLESMLLGDPFHFLVDWPPFAFIRRHIPSLVSPLSRLMRVDTLRRFVRAETALLFYKCLPDKTFTVYPRRNRIRNHRQTCTCHSGFRLDEEIISNACQRAQNGGQEEQKSKEENSLLVEKMNRMETMLIQLQSDQSKLFEILQSSGHNRFN